MIICATSKSHVCRCLTGFQLARINLEKMEAIPSTSIYTHLHCYNDFLFLSLSLCMRVWIKVMNLLASAARVAGRPFGLRAQQSHMLTFKLKQTNVNRKLVQVDLSLEELFDIIIHYQIDLYNLKRPGVVERISWSDPTKTVRNFSKSHAIYPPVVEHDNRKATLCNLWKRGFSY